MNNDVLSQPHPYSHLFTVRLWLVELGQGQREVRIQAKHVLSGETRYCQTWSELVAFLQAKITGGKKESDGIDDFC